MPTSVSIPPPERLAALERFLLELNAEAATAILPRFRAEYGVEDKGGDSARYDPVTEADREAETAVRRLIAARFPEHGVIGEEFGEDRPDAEFVWVIDPIDGTRAFVAGLPLWTTLIALRFQGEPVLGSIAQPWLDELYVGSPAGSRLIGGGDGDRLLRVRACSDISQAAVASTDPEFYFDGAELGAWRQVLAAARFARLGCDAYAYAMVALGRLDLVVESALKPWDVDAAVPLIAGAGGLVTDWRGDPIGRQGGQMVISGGRAVLDEALTALRRAAK